MKAHLLYLAVHTALIHYMQEQNVKTAGELQMKVNWVAGEKVHRIELEIPYFKSDGWDDFLEAITCAVEEERKAGNMVTKICFGKDLPEYQQIVDLGVMPDNMPEETQYVHLMGIVFRACVEVSKFAHGIR